MCRAAGPHEPITVREMMFGSREKFDYFVCRACGSLQVDEALPPEQMAKHYGPGYYSFDRQGGGRLARWLRVQRDRAQLGVGGGLAGRVLARVKPERIVGVLGQLGLDKRASILDVGTGSGFLLDRLAAAGFSNLLGIDPFIGGDTVTTGGVRVLKRGVQDATGTFDLVMFNHSLEHVTDPVADLNAARELLAPDGICLVRIPTTSGEAWEVYGADWVQIDAPRHIVVPSRDGMAIGAQSAGLKIDRQIDDSDSFQFTGSERYRNDFSLHDPAGGNVVDAASLKAFRHRADELNRMHRGDQTSFVMRRAT